MKYGIMLVNNSLLSCLNMNIVIRIVYGYCYLMHTIIIISIMIIAKVLLDSCGLINVIF